METELMHELELMVDNYGLAEVLETLSDVCHAKHEHIEHAWQDRGTAAPWKRLGVAIDRVRAQAETRGLKK